MSLSKTGLPQLGHSYSTSSAPLSLPATESPWGALRALSKSTTAVSETPSANAPNSVPHASHLRCEGEISSPQKGHSNLTSSKTAPHRGQLLSVPATVLPHTMHPKTKTGRGSSPMLRTCVYSYLNHTRIAEIALAVQCQSISTCPCSASPLRPFSKASSSRERVSWRPSPCSP